MSYGLQCWDQYGRECFNSNTAVGGVCLGYYPIAPGNTSAQTIFSFPNYTNGGYYINPQTSWGASGTVDMSLGYLRFIMTGAGVGYGVFLFAK